MEFSHISVMPEEALEYLAIAPGGIYVDGTLGGAGHALRILDASSPGGLLIGFDRDKEALDTASQRLAPYGDRARLFHRNFDRLSETVAELGVQAIDGFLLDLGVSSHQLDRGERGFSFQKDAPLDMRMDTSSGPTAGELVNTLPEAELERIIRDYGEERWARRIALFIAAAREKGEVETTLQLADIIKGAIPKAKWEERIHPATRTFQALRIAVNDELGSLERGLASAVGLLKKGGRGVVISFHSLEDRIVKNAFRDAAGGCRCPKDLPRCACGNVPQVRILTSRPVLAAAAETALNPRARSAKLRAVEKL